MSELHERLRRIRRGIDRRLGLDVSPAESRKAFADFRKALEREHRRRVRPRRRRRTKTP